jgi:hypothetical protein
MSAITQEELKIRLKDICKELITEMLESGEVKIVSEIQEEPTTKGVLLTSIRVGIDNKEIYRSQERQRVYWSE